MVAGLTSSCALGKGVEVVLLDTSGSKKGIGFALGESGLGLAEVTNRGVNVAARPVKTTDTSPEAGGTARVAGVAEEAIPSSLLKQCDVGGFLGLVAKAAVELESSRLCLWLGG